MYVWTNVTIRTLAGRVSICGVPGSVNQKERNAMSKHLASKHYRPIVRAAIDKKTGDLVIEVTPFADAARMDRFEEEVAEAIMRVFGDDTLEEFRALNPPKPHARM
jgi:hypothetical protein